MVLSTREIVGGEFEAAPAKSIPLGELSKWRLPLDGVWTLSGRAAFAIILKRLMSRGISHVHLPAFLCESLLLPVKALGLEYSFYPVDRSLAAHPAPPKGAAVLLIHYFGWLNPSTVRLRSESINSFYLIEDFSHIFLSKDKELWNNQSNIFFSARKFGPVPLGGWCNMQEDLSPCDDRIECLFWRSLAARLSKHIYLADKADPIDPAIETFYLDALNSVEQFLDSELSLSSLPARALDLIKDLDLDMISEKRRQNWTYVKDALPKNIDSVQPVLYDNTVPLGLVVSLGNRNGLRRYLAEHRVFCPIHWSLPKEVSRQDFPDASYTADHCLTIPIDQRYDINSLERVIDLLKGFD